MHIIIKIFLLITLPIVLNAQGYKRFHNRAIVADTHNDILTSALEDNLAIDHDLTGKTHSDINRFKKGGVDIQFFSVWCDGLKKEPYKWAMRQIDTLYAVAKRNPQKIKIVLKSSDLLPTVKARKLAAMFGLEGGHMIENNLVNLDNFYNRGVRYMTLTWNNSTDWATSAQDETTKKDSLKHLGLTQFGKEVIRHMNKIGMMVDLSHVGEQTFWDAINTTSKPVIVSHSCVYALCPHRRNLKDDQIKAVAVNGGVIHLNFYSGFLDSTFDRRTEVFNLTHKYERDSLVKINPEPYYADMILFKKYPEEVQALRPPLSVIIDHIDYIVKLTGINFVGLGSDFDGVNSLPRQLDDVTKLPLITKELFKRGYSKKDVRKILGENLLRIYQANVK